ncbi:MAG: signal peptidase I [Pirellulales bacterium]|nr:signal peptidase I [Pirellulales bacterium]
MAPTLLGEHRQVVCGDCGIEFSCDSSYRPVAPRAVCPNCGFAGNDLESPSDLSGDRVLVDRSAYRFRAPRRWEAVAFRHPRQFAELAVKRVVGLPGETVEIRRGDVYIDGRIARKPLALQFALAIPVDDANFASEKLPPRWQGENEASRWKIAGETKGKRRLFCESPADSCDWFVYRHARRLAGPEARAEPAPVEDTLAYNQNRPRRVEDVHAVCDLLLSFQLAKIEGGGKFFIRATDGRTVFRVELDNAKKVVAVFRDDIPLEIAGSSRPLKDGMRIAVSLFDRQFLLAFDDREVLALPLEEVAEEPPSTVEPFALGVRGLSAIVEDLRVFRDVYYTEPIGRVPCGWGGVPIVLGGDEYYVLGDNSPISEDSRTWGRHAPILCNSLLGKPLAVIFPARSDSFFGRRFQIPDLGRIRYIR